jgi:hypothetical protein
MFVRSAKFVAFAVRYFHSRLVVGVDRNHRDLHTSFHSTVGVLPPCYIGPLFFGLLAMLNLQVTFLSPPVVMSTFDLKDVSPPQVTLNQLFAAMLPFIGFQVFTRALLFIYPVTGRQLPRVT